MFAQIISVVIFLAEATTQAGSGPMAAAIAVFTGIGAGVGMGIATGKAVEAIARQPEASKKIQAVLLLGLAFAETTAIYGTFIALLVFTR